MTLKALPSVETSPHKKSCGSSPTRCCRWEPRTRSRWWRAPWSLRLFACSTRLPHLSKLLSSPEPRPRPTLRSSLMDVPSAAGVTQATYTSVSAMSGLRSCASRAVGPLSVTAGERGNAGRWSSSRLMTKLAPLRSGFTARTPWCEPPAVVSPSAGTRCESTTVVAAQRVIVPIEHLGDLIGRLSSEDRCRLGMTP